MNNLLSYFRIVMGQSMGFTQPVVPAFILQSGCCPATGVWQAAIYVLNPRSLSAKPLLGESVCQLLNGVKEQIASRVTENGEIWRGSGANMLDPETTTFMNHPISPIHLDEIGKAAFRDHPGHRVWHNQGVISDGCLKEDPTFGFYLATTHMFGYDAGIYTGMAGIAQPPTVRLLVDCLLTQLVECGKFDQVV